MSLRCARGQASLMMVAVVGVLLALTVVLFAFGSALGAKGRHQRAADLAAISAAQVMRELYPHGKGALSRQVRGAPAPRPSERVADLNRDTSAHAKGGARSGSVREDGKPCRSPAVSCPERLGAADERSVGGNPACLGRLGGIGVTAGEPGALLLVPGQESPSPPVAPVRGPRRSVRDA
jgi:hypothetical protein